MYDIKEPLKNAGEAFKQWINEHTIANRSAKEMFIWGYLFAIQDVAAWATDGWEKESITAACPYCQEVINGTAKDIDSGIRKHLDFCAQRPAEENL